MATTERYGRGARWFHAGLYLTVLVLLVTGWWLTLGREGRPSALSELVGLPDTTLHDWAGWLLAAVAVLGVCVGARATRTFLRESVRYDPGDVRWLAAWPRAVWTGRFPRHEGHFDPGQRVANLVLTVLLVVLLVSGVALSMLHGGPAFVWALRVHKVATWLVTPLLLGHILIAAGVLPGYRGVWRSMHLGGRLDRDVAARLWPGWLERQGGGSRGRAEQARVD